MSGQHASIAPSAAGIWGNCSGYLAVKHVAADHDTDQTRAGTASHWVYEQCVVDGYDPEDLVGHQDPHGTVVDDGMAEGARHMVEMVEQLREQYPDGDELVEHRVYMPQVHDNNWGTLDYSRAMIAQRLIVLGDYKHGHREVSAERNLQLVDYALGLLNHYGLDLGQNLDLVIEFRICQPFAYSPQGPVKTWRATVEQLLPVWRQLHDRANEAPLMTVGKYCRDCPAVGRCMAAIRAGYSVIDYTGEPFEIADMTGQELAVERNILQTGLKLLEARLSDVDDQLMHRLKQGEAGTGLALKGTSGRAKWLNDDQTTVNALATLGLDVSKPAAITPTQAAKLAKTDEQRKAIAAMQHRPGGKLEIVNAADKPAARAFSNKE
ncbi:gp67 [Vibrio phage CKB-S1]|nr:gp67 [Vibrio phage CKB-S1]